MRFWVNWTNNMSMSGIPSPVMADVGMMLTNFFVVLVFVVRNHVEALLSEESGDVTDFLFVLGHDGLVLKFQSFLDGRVVARFPTVDTVHLVQCDDEWCLSLFQHFE